MFPLVYDTKHISIECKKLNKEMKDYYDQTILENLYNRLNEEMVKKCTIYMPQIKHSQNSFNYGKKGFFNFLFNILFFGFKQLFTINYLKRNKIMSTRSWF